MEKFYEKSREERKDVDIHYSDQYSGWFEHYHDNLEVLIFLRGEGYAVINGREYKLNNKNIVVADSYDVHGYKMVKKKANQVITVIIPYRYLAKFNYYKNGKRIVNPIIKKESFCEKLVRLIEEFDFTDSESWQTEAAVNFFLSVLITELELGENNKTQDSELFRKILHLIHDNFREKLSLKMIAKNLGYTGEHISRVFHHFLKKSLPQYINELRFDEVERLRSNGQAKMQDCIFEAGFQSLQSYYRYKKERMS